MQIYFEQEMKYHYDINKPQGDFPAYLIAMGEHCGYRFYVKNLNGRHPTAYVAIPEEHPLHGWSPKWDEAEKIDVHGGVTYTGDSVYPVQKNDDWIIGWDYGHAGDYAAYYEDGSYLEKHSHRWTVEEIIAECKGVCEQLKGMEK